MFEKTLHDSRKNIKGGGDISVTNHCLKILSLQSTVDHKIGEMYNLENEN